MDDQTVIALEVEQGEFAQAIALGLILLTLAFLVNVVLARSVRTEANQGLY